ncbi:hypothetical protein HMSSN036_60670 [Paenibacillus macerans]|nr:hypothetical protein HMSSN036_60670 [Paenibacillus macerans]
MDLIKEIPKSYLLREANQAVTINLMLFGLALLVILTATILISIRVTAPIKRLSNYMSQVKTGNLNVDVLPAGNDEVGLLTERFRTMMDTINNLILREYKLELSSKNNQLRALQAQINPHFLNNTLQIIGTLALELKVPQIYTLISSLAKMMHYSMHSGDRIVTLKDELEHVKAYVELQKERFENRFAYRCEVAEPLLQVAMPKLILQPIMETTSSTASTARARTDGCGSPPRGRRTDSSKSRWTTTERASRRTSWRDCSGSCASYPTLPRRAVPATRARNRAHRPSA